MQIEVDEEVGQEELMPPAFEKLLSERRARAEALVQALSNLWCPLRSLDCKELGDNKFIFPFYQASREKKALEDGLWMLSDELLVMADIDDSKTLEEIDFSFISI